MDTIKLVAVVVSVVVVTVATVVVWSCLVMASQSDDSLP